MNAKSEKVRMRLWAVAVWLVFWQAASMALAQEILLVSPVSVMLRLAELVLEASFWKAVAFSFFRIVAGFLLAFFAGMLFAGLAARNRWLRELLHPLLTAIKATPVASFVILCLLFIPSRNLSVFISFLMVFPIVYANTMQGIESMDIALLEMAQIFRIPLIRQLRTIYLTQVTPYLHAACASALGLAWKSGIAAEVIGMPKGSIGERLYQAKIYLDTPDLFAWTVVIIGISILFERLFLWGLSYVGKAGRENI